MATWNLGINPARLGRWLGRQQPKLENANVTIHSETVHVNGRGVVVERLRPRKLPPIYDGQARLPPVRERPLVTSVIPPNNYPGGVLDFIQEGDVVLTAAQAALIAKHCVHQVQIDTRPLTHPDAIKHIEVLTALMSSGSWLEKTQLRFGLLNGQLWVLDGNHRAPAQAAYGRPILWNIAIDICKDEDELRRMFNKFNTNTRGRTDAQILNATQFAQNSGITRQVATAVYAAMPAIIAGFNTERAAQNTVKNRVFDDRLTAARSYLEAAKLFDDCLKRGDGKVKRKLLSAGVTAVALVTLKAQPQAASEFWRGVARNDGLKKGDPRHTLVMELLTRSLNTGASHQHITIPAVAWNAWYGRKKLSQIHASDSGAVKIDGTPFRGV